MTFQKTYLKSAKSNDSKKSNTPQIEISNPLKKDVYVNAIELILDEAFNVKGIAEIKINNISILNPEHAGNFRRYKSFQIPSQNQILKKDSSVEIFIWNGIPSHNFSMPAFIYRYQHRHVHKTPGAR